MVLWTSPLNKGADQDSTPRRGYLLILLLIILAVVLVASYLKFNSAPTVDPGPEESNNPAVSAYEEIRKQETQGVRPADFYKTDLYEPGTEESVGEVVFEEFRDKVIVTIRLRGSYDDSKTLAAYIYTGGCNDNGNILYSLGLLSNGIGESYLGGKLAELGAKTPFNIRVVEEQDTNSTVSCSTVADL